MAFYCTFQSRKLEIPTFHFEWNKYLSAISFTCLKNPWKRNRWHSQGLLFCMLTISSSVSSVTLKMSPCSVWARKKNMDFVLWVAEQTKIMPLSGSSRSFYKMQRKRKRKALWSHLTSVFDLFCKYNDRELNHMEVQNEYHDQRSLCVSI